MAEPLRPNARGNEIRIAPICPATPIRIAAPIAADPGLRLHADAQAIAGAVIRIAAHGELAEIDVRAGGLQRDAQVINAGIEPDRFEIDVRRLVAIVIFGIDFGDAGRAGGRVAGGVHDHHGIHLLGSIDIAFIAVRPAAVGASREAEGEHGNSDQPGEYVLFHTILSGIVRIGSISQMGDLPQNSNCSVRSPKSIAWVKMGSFF